MKYQFDSRKKSFLNGIKESIDAHFRSQNLHPSGNARLYAKAIMQVLASAVLYVILVFFTPGVAVSLFLCILLGLDLALIGFNVMHEGGHQSFSRHRAINTISAYALNALGGISYYWKVKHNVNHHTYTNIEELDSDIDVKPFMRLHEGQPWRPYHRYQHLYWVLLYGFSYLAWVFYEDFVKYFSQRISVNDKRQKLPMREQFIFWLTKVMFVTMYVILPIISVGFISWLIGFLTVTIICGFTTSVVFQLAHVVEGTHFHGLPDNNDNKQEWAIHQVESTANFATSNKTLHWLLGGLNFQIEHHLFPRISHVHYPAISHYVKNACKEAGVTYLEFNSMLAALGSHLAHLKKLGAAGK